MEDKEGKSAGELGAWGPRDAESGGNVPNGAGLGKGTSHGVVRSKDKGSGGRANDETSAPGRWAPWGNGVGDGGGKGGNNGPNRRGDCRAGL